MTKKPKKITLEEVADIQRRASEKAIDEISTSMAEFMISSDTLKEFAKRDELPMDVVEQILYLYSYAMIKKAGEMAMEKKNKK